MASKNTGSMTASASSRRIAEKKVRIKVVGVGGAGVNAVDRLVMDNFNEVSFLSINTDAQALASSVVTEKLQIGETLTHGLGAGGDPEVGRDAALENTQQLRDLLEGYDLIFVAAGMGGGTGTGAGPVVAQIAREEGALVLALVTMPFSYEGKHRASIARDGLSAMETSADAVICIPNDKLLAMADENTSVLDAFRPTDEFLSNGVRKIWQMLTRTGLINIDFADLRAVLRRRNGETLFGFGEGAGEKKLEQALQGALSSPLLNEGNVLSKACGVLVGITHGPDFAMSQLKKLMSEIHKHLGPHSACKQGIVVDENYADRLTVVLIASTGEAIAEERPLVPSNKKVGTTKKSKASSESEEERISESSETKGNEVFDFGVFSSSKKKGGAYEFVASSPKQGTLKLDDATRGLFEKVERTVVNGEDLDRPTFIRRGFVLKNI
jgi:cell division protein FtsZ